MWQQQPSQLPNGLPLSVPLSTLQFFSRAETITASYVKVRRAKGQWQTRWGEEEELEELVAVAGINFFRLAGLGYFIRLAQNTEWVFLSPKMANTVSLCICVCEYLCWHQAIKYVSLFAFDWFVAFRVVATQQPLARHHYTVQQTKKFKN